MPDYQTADMIGMPYLYRYQPFHIDRLKAVIVQKKLYFSKPSDFNDPWDCRPCYDLDLADEASVQAHIEYIVRVYRERGGHLGEAALSEHVALLRDDRSVLVDVVRRIHVSAFEGIDKRYRVLCLSGCPLHPLLWAHYARSHTGVCLQFANDRFFRVAIQIFYRDQYPSYSILATGADLLAPLITKSSDWSYEEEYRLIAQERAEATRRDTIMTDNHVVSYPPESLRAVYLGCRMSESDKKTVLDLIRQAGTRIAVHEVFIRPDRYALLDRPVAL